MESIKKNKAKPVKSKSVLVRIDPGLEKRVQRHADTLDIKVATLFRNAVRFYLEDLERNNAEVRAVIRGIIYAKMDRLEREFEQGKMVVFRQIIPVNPAMGSSVCVDENERKYIVYEIALREGDTRVTAIDRFAERLYEEWKYLDVGHQSEFVANLHGEHVCFTIKSLVQDD